MDPTAPLSARAEIMRRVHPEAAALPPRGPLEPLEMQVVSWHSADAEVLAAEDDDDDDDRGRGGRGGRGGGGGGGGGRPELAFAIHAFGVGRDGRSVCLRVDGFPPFFYVKVPPDLGRGPRRAAAVRAVAELLKSHEARIGGDVAEAVPLRKRDFWGFNNGAEFDFVRLRFRSLRGMRTAAARIRDRAFTVRGFGAVRLALYESNIDPLLRFVHVQALQPAGWLAVDARHLERLGPEYSPCDAAYSCQWKRAKPAPGREQQGLAPLLLAAFDIECSSAHGDFPVAKKDYRRLAIDLAQEWDRRALRAASAYDASAHLERVVFEAFGLLGDAPPPGARGQVARLQLKDPRADREPVRRLMRMHVGDLYSVLKTGGGKGPPRSAAAAGGGGDSDDSDGDGAAGGRGGRAWWVRRPAAAGTGEDDEPAAPPQAAKGGYQSAKDKEKEKEKDQEEDTSMLGALTAQLNALFQQRWPLEGDPVIQIGMTLGVYGAPGDAVSERHVLVLGTCDAVATETGLPVVVHRFDRELDMLLAWVELVRELDPDVMLGYNIFGFDMAYLHGRAEELLGEKGCVEEFCQVS